MLKIGQSTNFCRAEFFQHLSFLHAVFNVLVHKFLISDSPATFVAKIGRLKRN